eukprot:jgi/Mesvir1/22656/Mv14090-RA.1
MNLATASRPFSPFPLTRYTPRHVFQGESAFWNCSWHSSRGAVAPSSTSSTRGLGREVACWVTNQNSWPSKRTGRLSGNSAPLIPEGRLAFRCTAIAEDKDGVFSPGVSDRQAVIYDKSGKAMLKNMTWKEMEAWLVALGESPRNVHQLWTSLYREKHLISDVADLAGVSKPFAARMQSVASVDALQVDKVARASDGTCKILYKLPDGAVVETVLIPAESGRRTICVSSQVGCALNCQFCYTGRMGLRGHLSTAQIVDQVVLTRRLFSRPPPPPSPVDATSLHAEGDAGRADEGEEAEAVEEISNIVFMGMGEPLHNYTNVMSAIEILTDTRGLAFSHNKVTVSTSGLVPQIRRLCQESDVQLAVSLNATTDEVRNWIMPINRKYPLQMLMDTLREELPKRHRRRQQVLFEYIMLAGVNDSLEDAHRIVELTAGIPCKVNLITFNPHDGTEFRCSPPDRVLAFRDIIMQAGRVATIRKVRNATRAVLNHSLGT